MLPKVNRNWINTRYVTDWNERSYIYNNTLNLIFNLSIVDQKQLFNFYRIEPMPVFHNGKAYIAQIDAHHMAISRSGSNYITVLPDEYTECIYNKQKCSVSTLTISKRKAMNSHLIFYSFWKGNTLWRQWITSIWLTCFTLSE